MTEERKTVEQFDFMRQVGDLLRFHQNIGLDYYPFAIASGMVDGPVAEQPSDGKTSPTAVVPPVDKKKQSVAPREKHPQGLKDLEKEIILCHNCRRAEEGKAPVVSVGNVGAVLLIVVEQPIASGTRDEQLLGGEDGALLDKMLDAIKISTDHVCMTSLVKCGPPTDRPTTREERIACLGYLERQISVLRPNAVLVFGEKAAQTLFKSDRSLFHLRGKVNEISGIPALASYHPQRLRSEPALKQMAWQDLQLLQRILAGKRSQ